MLQLIIYRPNFRQERKACSRIWNCDVKGENVNTSMQHQTYARMITILQRFLLPLL